MLPEVQPSSGVVGTTVKELFGRPVPIAGIAGDQQAATFGQACFQPGEAKNTYGTGCFLLLNTGKRPIASSNNLLTTVGWQLGQDVTYCLEGSVFVAGAVVQWLRDGLGLIERSEDIEALAATVPDSGGVTLVPAFVGLGAPYWDPNARGTILGITRGTNKGHLARAALEAIAWQAKDLVVAMQSDTKAPLQGLRVDGGACTNDGLMQFQADVLGVPVRRPQVAETTALGAAYLAGLATGVWQDLGDIQRNWVLDREFTPAAEAGRVEQGYRRWQRAVERARGWVQ
jgi:glycerol kinase